MFRDRMEHFVPGSRTRELGYEPLYIFYKDNPVNVQRKLEELRRESYIILWVIRSTMKIVTLFLSSLSLSFGYATCNV